MNSIGYREVINFFCERYSYDSYLELGLDNPESTFNHINCKEKISVDVNPLCNPTYCMTTDEYFSKLSPDKKFDIIFIDACHEKSFVRKDFDNAMKHLSPNGTIIMDDVAPIWPDWLDQKLCGNAWEVFFELGKRDDLHIGTILPSHTGIGFVRLGKQVPHRLEIDSSFDFLNRNREVITRPINFNDLDKVFTKEINQTIRDKQSYNIVNVTPGLLSIPPNGWGAVEKIIWETHLCLLEAGHNSKVLYLDDIPKNADIIHIHVANLANEAHRRGIPYYFTMHDHHAYLYGKNSDVYKENLEAIRNAKRAFVPAKYLVDWFEGIPEYFSHGVNTDYFTDDKTRTTHKLLCVANNGFIHDQSEDRKGFGFAIEVAKRLGLPITIVGPENNRKYFQKFPSDYDKLTIIYNATEEELRKIYQEHSIFLHPSVLEAGHPNLTLLEAMSSGLPVLATFEDENELEGLVKIERNVDSILDGIAKIFADYSTYTKMAREQAEKLSWKNRTKELLKIYEIQNTKGESMKEKLIFHYNQTKIVPRKSKEYIPNISISNIDGVFVEITGEASDNQYKVEFINKDTGVLEYSSQMGINCWSKCAIKYFVNWNIRIYENDILIKDYHTDYKNKMVYIALDSKSLGDTLAWFPYVEEFRKKHECGVICSTFWNNLFETEYSNIKFIKPGEVANGIVAMYSIGWFYRDSDNSIDSFKNPKDFTKQNLQKTAADILGLDFKEIKPNVTNKKLATKKQICIAIHGSAQTKYWNNPTGWQEVVDWCNDNGYQVKLLSSESEGYMGNSHPTGIVKHTAGRIENVIDEIIQSKAFIGIGSGLTWLSWCVNTPTILISGFSEPYTEPSDCYRISSPDGKCSGCFNRYRFDAGDWNWCPDHKNTDRQFECTKSIKGDMVIRELKKLLAL